MEPSFWTNKHLPTNPAPLEPKWNGGCNTHLPNTDTYERMLWTIHVFISQGMYVMLDYQLMVSAIGADSATAADGCSCRERVRATETNQV